MIQTNYERRLLFVYGTLKRGEVHADLLASQELVGEGTVDGYALYLVEAPFPFMAPQRGGRVHGELYRIEPQRLRRIAAMELRAGYREEAVLVKLGSGETSWAVAYTVPPERVQTGRLVSGGRWIGQGKTERASDH